ncbi:MAG: hypothetical protein Q9165_004216 [Trypethelium subeluteriae]
MLFTIQALGPSVTNILGVDLSPAMVAGYNSRVSEVGLPSTAVHAIEGNILSDASWPSLRSDRALAAADFDIAAICMGVHHFSSPSLAIQRLTEFLKPGTGVLLIVDIVKEVEKGDDDPSPDHQRRSGGAGHTIHPQHNGFVEAEMREIFAGAGLKDFMWETCPSKTLMKGKNDEDLERILFFARGVRKE